MNLKETIHSKMIEAMRSKNKERVAAIRLITASIKQQEVDKRIELDDAAVLAILDKMISQRKESIRQFKEADRQDLVAKEEFELGIIQEFLPEQLSDQEVNEIITTTISKLSASSMRDMGKVMAELKAQLQGRTDMTQVSKAVKDKLS